MNPLSIKARNYRTFDELDLDLPTGCVAMLGENGAGKSSIVNLIDLALFGPQSRTLADCLTDDTVEENLELELTFEHAGDTYRVRRTYSPRGRGQTKVDLEHRIDDESSTGSSLDWEPLTRETAAATQTAIEELLGLSRETFRASAFLAQGDGAAFTEAVPRDRKRILCEVLGLDLWDRLLERARDDRKAAETELVKVDNMVAGAEAELTGRLAVEQERGAARMQRDAATLKIESSEQELAQVNDQLAKAKAMQAASKSAEDALEAARQAHGAALTNESRLRNELEQIQARLTGRDALRILVGQLPALEETRTRMVERTQQADAHDRLVVDRNRLLGEASGRNEKAHDLRHQADMLELRASDNPATCELCGQHLGEEARAHTAASYRQDGIRLDEEARGLDEQAEALTVKLEPLRDAKRPSPEDLAWAHDQIQRAQNAREQIAALDEAASRVATLDEQLRECRETIPGLEDQVKTAQANLRALLSDDGALSLPELDEQARDLTAGLQGYRNAVTAAVEIIARCDERLDRMNRLAEAVKINGARRDELHGEIDLLCELERAYGKDGIPALIIESVAIPQLEVEASRILTVLGGAATQVELRTQRELKSGDGTKESLDIVLHTDTGERDYSTFSGGERTRIDLGLRLALAKLLADRRGAESRVLVIDEPDGLDAQGFSALVEILNGLQDTFSKILVVSHHPDLRHAFDQSLEIVKENGRSRVVGAGDREPVAA